MVRVRSGNVAADVCLVHNACKPVYGDRLVSGAVRMIIVYVINNFVISDQGKFSGPQTGAVIYESLHVYNICAFYYSA